MVETLPMLEKDPRAAYKVSRQLRILVFSLVVSIVLVSLLIVFVRFVWDSFVVPNFGQAPYNSNPFFVVPAMLLIAAFLGKLLWDTAEEKPPTPRRK
ncbi:MAG TPA: hypothetical protein VGB18_05020 [Candidatus Thermoplasmatota archaeon]